MSTIESIGMLDLYEYYLTSPTSPARFRDATPTFIVNGYVHGEFCDLVDRLGWEITADSELAEEAHGGWGAITIRRKEPTTSTESGAMLRWDGSRKGIEAICKWANEVDDVDGEPFVQYEYTGPDDVHRVTVATDDGDYDELCPWDWLIRTDKGFRVEKADGWSTSDDPNPNAARPTGMCGSPVKCQRCPSDFLCHTKASDEKQLITGRSNLAGFTRQGLSVD